MTLVLVMVGAAVGAPLRYLTDLAVQSRHDTLLPWGTLTVNVVGSFVLGILGAAVVGGHGPAALRPLVGTGLCGALTTYSTFSYETVRLVEQDAPLLAAGNVVGSLALGLASALAGLFLAGAIW